MSNEKNAVQKVAEGIVDDMVEPRSLTEILDGCFVPSSYVRTAHKKIVKAEQKNEPFSTFGKIMYYTTASALELVRLGAYAYISTLAYLVAKQ